MGFSKLAIAVGLVGLFSPVSVYAVTCDSTAATPFCSAQTPAAHTYTVPLPASGAPGASCTSAQHRVISKLEVVGVTANTDTFTVETKAGTKTLTECSTSTGTADFAKANCGSAELADVTAATITCTGADTVNCNIKLGVTWACVDVPSCTGTDTKACAAITLPYPTVTPATCTTSGTHRVLKEIEVLSKGTNPEAITVSTVDSNGNFYAACSTPGALGVTGALRLANVAGCGSAVPYDVTATIACKTGSACTADARLLYECVAYPAACTTGCTTITAFATASPYATVPSACGPNQHRILNEIQVKNTDTPAKTYTISTKDSKGRTYSDCSTTTASSTFWSKKACGLDSAYDVTATITCASSGNCGTTAFLDYKCVDIPAACDYWCTDVAGGIVAGKPITYVNTKPAACPAGQHRILNEIQVKNTDDTPAAFTVTVTDSNGTAYSDCSTTADSTTTYLFQSQKACGTNSPFDVTATISCITGTCKTKAFVDYKCVPIPAACTAGCQDKTLDAENVFNTTTTCDAKKRRVVNAIQAKNKAGTTTFTVETKDASGTIIDACSKKNVTIFATNAVCGDGKSDATTTIRCDGETCSVSLQVDYGCVDLVTAAPTPAPTPAPTTAAPKSAALLTTPSSSLIICLAIVALRYFGYEM